jgi:hypothetical protein
MIYEVYNSTNTGPSGPSGAMQTNGPLQRLCHLCFLPRLLLPLVQLPPDDPLSKHHQGAP